MNTYADIFVPLGWAMSVAAIAAAMGFYYTKEAVADHERRAKEADLAAALKRQMIDKGYTVADMVRLIEARPGDAGKA